MRYIASCSFGKDSLAMVLRLIEECKPLDEVVFYDTGMEFGAIYNNLKKLKSILVVEWGMTEKDCLEYCRNNGWDWKEETPNGYIDLYDILDRVSCWCCSNKNRKELKNIYLYLPYYWNKLKEFQSKTERPMKKYSKKGILYGNVFDMEKIFETETKREKGSVI